MHLTKDKIIDIIKVLGATIILTPGILRLTPKTGDSVQDDNFPDYVHLTDTGSTETTPNTEQIHQSAPTNICDTIPSLCEKISFIGTFSENQKNSYIDKEHKITSFIDQNNAQKRDFLNTLKTMQINNTEGRRGYATWDKVVLNTATITSDDEFYQVSTHELGHIADLGFLQGKSKEKDPQYTEFEKTVFAKDDPSLYYYKLSRDSETIRKSNAKKSNFCSVYGMSDPFEDFAECFNLYLNHNKVFKYLAQKDSILAKKYNFLASMFKGSYIYSNTANITIFKDQTDNRVRDTTKINLQP